MRFSMDALRASTIVLLKFERSSPRTQQKERPPEGGGKFR
jgi:hypothetical protein